MCVCVWGGGVNRDTCALVGFVIRVPRDLYLGETWGVGWAGGGGGGRANRDTGKVAFPLKNTL